MAEPGHHQFGQSAVEKTSCVREGSSVDQRAPKLRQVLGPPNQRAPGVPVCQHWSVGPRRIAGLIGAATLAMCTMQSAPMPSAHGDACPDAEVVFALSLIHI